MTPFGWDIKWPAEFLSLYVCGGFVDWFSFLANIVEVELLCNKNLAFDHLRAFSASEVNRVSRAVRFSWICLNITRGGLIVFMI